MTSPISFFFLFLGLFLGVFANVEKAIFLAPAPLRLPEHQLSLDSLQLGSLFPQTQSILTTKLSVAFPTESAPRGIDHWYILHNLTEGQRYEVRICWPAIQPTEFWMNTYTLPEVFENPNLIGSLARFSEQARDPELVNREPTSSDYQGDVSLLFLHIQAAADYYSTNRTLMQRPPLVDVDIILDPYLMNAIPRSLVPTGLYIVLIAVFAWYVSNIIVAQLKSLASAGTSKPHED